MRGMSLPVSRSASRGWSRRGQVILEEKLSPSIALKRTWRAWRIISRGMVACSIRRVAQLLWLRGHHLNLKCSHQKMGQRQPTTVPKRSPPSSLRGTPHLIRRPSSLPRRRQRSESMSSDPNQQHQHSLQYYSQRIWPIKIKSRQCRFYFPGLRGQKIFKPIIKNQRSRSNRIYLTKKILAGSWTITISRSRTWSTLRRYRFLEITRYHNNQIKTTMEAPRSWAADGTIRNRIWKWTRKANKTKICKVRAEKTTTTSRWASGLVSASSRLRQRRRPRKRTKTTWMRPLVTVANPSTAATRTKAAHYKLRN